MTVYPTVHYIINKEIGKSNVIASCMNNRSTRDSGCESFQAYHAKPIVFIEKVIVAMLYVVVRVLLS